MKTVIRPAVSEDDVDQAQALVNTTKEGPERIRNLGGFFRKPDLLLHVNKQHESGDITVLVAEREGQIVGMCETFPRAANVQMGLVAVDPDSKRQGIGSALYAAHSFYACLEGRSILTDKIRQGNAEMRGMLSYCVFYPASHRRRNSRNFADLQYFEFDLAFQGSGTAEFIYNTRRKQEFEFFFDPAHDIPRAGRVVELSNRMRDAGRDVSSVGKNRSRVLDVLTGIAK